MDDWKFFNLPKALYFYYIVLPTLKKCLFDVFVLFFHFRMSFFFYLGL